MGEIVWTREATRCLENIYDFISEENPTAAQKVISGIYEKIQLLRTQPRLGQRYDAIGDREVRETLYGHYRIAYLLRSEDRIEILGIFHSAMDIESYLR
jgi:plasmid stabilization system protein ParE